MGGAFPGQFPPAFRIAALIQAALLIGLAMVVLARAGLILPTLKKPGNPSAMFGRVRERVIHKQLVYILIAKLFQMTGVAHKLFLDRKLTFKKWRSLNDTLIQNMI